MKRLNQILQLLQAFSLWVMFCCAVSNYYNTQISKCIVKKYVLHDTTEGCNLNAQEVFLKKSTFWLKMATCGLY